MIWNDADVRNIRQRWDSGHSLLEITLHLLDPHYWKTLIDPSKKDQLYLLFSKAQKRWGSEFDKKLKICAMILGLPDGVLHSARQRMSQKDLQNEFLRSPARVAEEAQFWPSFWGEPHLAEQRGARWPKRTLRRLKQVAITQEDVRDREERFASMTLETKLRRLNQRGMLRKLVPSMPHSDVQELVAAKARGFSKTWIESVYGEGAQRYWSSLG